MRNFWLNIPRSVSAVRALELSKEAKHRLRMMQWYDEHGRNAALTCRHFGISRDTFYRWWRRYLESGPGGVAPCLQTARPALLEAPTPAVKGVPADAEVPAGERSVPSVLVIPCHHAQPVLRFPGQFKSPDGTYRPRDVQPEVPHTPYNAGVRDLSERDHAPPQRRRPRRLLKW